MLYLCGNALFQEILQSLMVRDDFKWPTNKVRAPFLNSKQNGHHFTIISREQLVLWRQRLAQISNWVKVLREYSTQSTIRRITFNSKWLGKIRKCQHRGRCQSCFKCDKSLISCHTLIEGIFFKKISKGTGQ